MALRSIKYTSIVVTDALHRPSPGIVQGKYTKIQMAQWLNDGSMSFYCNVRALVTNYISKQKQALYKA